MAKGHEDTGQPEGYTEAQLWKEQIEATKDVYADWVKRGEQISSRYRDERSKAHEQGQRHLNILWSNTEILTPAIYSQCPLAMAERRFLDRDPVGRVSAQILERVVRFELEDNGFHQGMKQAVKDFLLPGRGVLWVRYEPEFGVSVSLKTGAAFSLSAEDGDEEEIKGDAGEEKLEDTGEQLLVESVPVDYIHWKDFFIFPAYARTWSEVTGIAKRIYMSKDEVREKWPDLADKIQADTSVLHEGRKTGAAPSALFDRGDRTRVIFEIWNKKNRKVIWISTGYDGVIESVDDPLRLKGFFPIAEPILSVTTNDTQVPIPFYTEYQDQAIQVDELTQRINMLGKCVKVTGTYDASNRALRRLLDESVENELIPVDNWSAHKDKGGVEGAVSFMPLRDMVEALQVLVELRAKVMEDLDRVTGIADIMRGTSDARETLGGQRLKQNSATTRLDKLRDDVAVFARDTIRIVAEVVARHFSAKSLIKASGILYEEGISLDDYEAMQDLLQAPQEAPPAAPPQLPAPQGMPPQGPMPQPGAPMQPGMPPHPLPPQGMLQPGMPPHPLPPQPGGPPQPALGIPAPAGIPAGVPPQAPAGPPPIVEKIQRIEKAIKLLKDDIPRGYRITIETDSTIAGEVAQERQDSIAFLTAISKFLEQAQMIGSQNPEIVPVLGKLLQFGVRKFRTGREVESAIDDFVDKAAKSAQHLAQNPGLRPPSPEMMKAQADERKASAEIDKIKLSASLDAQNDQRRVQIDQAQAQRDATAQQAEEQRQTRLAEMKFQYEQRTLEMRMQMEHQKAQMQMQMEQAKMQMDHQRMQVEAAHEDRRRQQEMVHDQHRMGLEQQQREAEHAFGMREMEAKGKENEAARAHQAEQRKAQTATRGKGA